MRIKEIADAYDVKYELIGPNDPDLEPRALKKSSI